MSAVREIRAGLHELRARYYATEEMLRERVMILVHPVVRDEILREPYGPLAFHAGGPQVTLFGYQMAVTPVVDRWSIVVTAIGAPESPEQVLAA